MMILASAIMMAAAANAERVETASFNEVRVNVPARVRIIAGETYGVSINAQDSITAGAVRMNVKDGVLKLTTRDLDALDLDKETLCITIVTPIEPVLTVGREMNSTNVRNAFNIGDAIAKND